MHAADRRRRPETFARSIPATAALAFVVVTLICAAAASLAGSAATGTTVSGTVSGSDQGFLTGASVVLDGPQHREARTDADGRFAFSDVPRGHYQIAISADGYLPLDRTMDVGDASISVDIVLLRLAGVP